VGTQQVSIKLKSKEKQQKTKKDSNLGGICWFLNCRKKKSYKGARILCCSKLALQWGDKIKPPNTKSRRMTSPDPLSAAYHR
jgi:hypothetical protein